ncbi:unnamed protein product [Prunus brigantina]
MAEKYNHRKPVNGHPRRDEESTALQSEELKRQKRIKMYKYIVIFIVVQLIVLPVFGLTVMKVKTPKFRLGNIELQNLSSVPSTPSFDASFATKIRVKNTNWGPYKFDAGTVSFMYQGVTVGQVVVPKSKAKMRSTKKIDVMVSLNSYGLPSSSNLGTELKSGVLTLSSKGKLTGKVVLMLMMKKRKSATMDCTMTFDLSTKTLKTLQCK